MWRSEFKWKSALVGGTPLDITNMKIMVLHQAKAVKVLVDSGSMTLISETQSMWLDRCDGLHRLIMYEWALLSGNERAGSRIVHQVLVLFAFCYVARIQGLPSWVRGAIESGEDGVRQLRRDLFLYYSQGGDAGGEEIGDDILADMDATLKFTQQRSEQARSKASRERLQLLAQMQKEKKERDTQARRTKNMAKKAARLAKKAAQEWEAYEAAHDAAEAAAKVALDTRQSRLGSALACEDGGESKAGVQIDEGGGEGLGEGLGAIGGGNMGQADINNFVTKEAGYDMITEADIDSVVGAVKFQTKPRTVSLLKGFRQVKCLPITVGETAVSADTSLKQ